LWHSRHHDDNPFRVLEFGGNASKGPVFPHFEQRFTPGSAINQSPEPHNKPKAGFLHRNHVFLATS
jgi:hypothetical protein